MGKAVMGNGRGRGRKGNSRAAASNGQAGISADPLPGSTRAANYRRQRAGAPGKFVAQLTPKQAKRLRKQANKHGDRISQHETAALPVRSREQAERITRTAAQ